MSLAAEISLKIKHQTSSAPKQRNEPKWNKANIIDKIKTTEESIENKNWLQFLALSGANGPNA